MRALLLLAALLAAYAVAPAAAQQLSCSQITALTDQYVIILRATGPLASSS